MKDSLQTPTLDTHRSNACHGADEVECRQPRVGHGEDQRQCVAEAFVDSTGPDRADREAQALDDQDDGQDAGGQPELAMPLDRPADKQCDNVLCDRFVTHQHLHICDNPSVLALSRKKADRVIETRRPEASSKNKGGKDPSPALDVRPFRAGLAAAAGAPVDLAPIRNQVEAATSQKIAKWVRRGEVEAKKGAPRGDNPSLRYAQPGDVVRVPPHVLRPGQSQISFDRVRDVMLGFLERLDGRSPAEARALAEQLGLLEVPGRVTADAKTVVLPDKNHHSTAMFAFKGWLTEVTKGLKSAKRPGLAALREVFLGEDAHVKIEVQDTFVGQDPGESEAALRSSSYYVGRDGQPSRVRPDLFSGLEDNPYRNLATHTRVKVEPAGKKDVELSTKQLPVWVKDPAAPDFVEFFVADVFAKAMAGAGREYDGRSALTEEDGVLLRDALRRVQADEDHVHHEALEKVLVVPEKLTNTDKLRKKLELSKKGRAKIDN